MRNICSHIHSLCIVCFALVTTVAGETPIDFNREIRPLLAKHCYACHGADTAESNLRFDLRDSATQKAESGAIAIVPGKSSESEILKRVTSHDDSDRMPPEGEPLSEKQVQLLQRWIDEGAQYTKHWSFQPIQSVSIPSVKNKDWTRNPIDAFILSQLERNDLLPNQEEDARSLLRRLSYSILGLPPSIEEVEAFSKASQHGSQHFDLVYEEKVEAYLSDPRFGERWARHWLDLVRYAETNSFERDGDKPNAWKYRDYVIRSLNSDKPYDQFIREQLAGDELDEVTRESLIATGYYRLGIWDDEPADPQQALYDGFDDLVTVTGQGLLGLTLNCARCHDHKIDPLSQKDYYAMVAFFRDVTPYGNRGDEVSNSQIDLAPAETTQRREAIQQELQQLNQRKTELEQAAIVKMDAPLQRATEGPEREKVLNEHLDMFLDDSLKPEYQQLKKKIQELRRNQRRLPPPDATLGLAKCLPNPPTTHVLLRGSPQAEGDEVQPQFISLLDDPQNQYAPKIQPREKTAGRRRELAEWIVSENNWLTARVIVNRVWQHHFGRGIVRSSNNFGQLGDIPTHPELLDFLANELIKHNWSLKPIHRLILTSQTYRMASHDQTAGLQADPRNDLFWRFDPRRLSAEEVRDSMLTVTGKINNVMEGRSFYPDVSDEVKAGQSVPGKGWGDSSPAEKARRSIYIFIKRSLIPLSYPCSTFQKRTAHARQDS